MHSTLCTHLYIDCCPHPLPAVHALKLSGSAAEWVRAERGKTRRKWRRDELRPLSTEETTAKSSRADRLPKIPRYGAIVRGGVRAERGKGAGYGGRVPRWSRWSAICMVVESSSSMADQGVSQTRVIAVRCILECDSYAVFTFFLKVTGYCIKKTVLGKNWRLVNLKIHRNLRPSTFYDGPVVC